MYTFARYEVAFVGYSGSGKTSLIEKLVKRLSGRYRVGFVKHDAHRFSIDVEGKDTWRVARSGAASVFINDSEHHAFIGTGTLDESTRQSLFRDVDFVIAEGFRRSGMAKVVVVDSDGGILEQVDAGQIDHIIGFALRSGTGEGLRRRTERIAGGRPILDPNDEEAFDRLVMDYFAAAASEFPVYGLVLAGGSSDRMGQDKARITYHGTPQVRCAAELLSVVADRVFVSIRSEQAHDEVFRGLAQIHDRFLGFGPAAGILSAMHREPRSAWFVLGCDLPFVTAETVRTLFKARDPLKLATTYLSPEDGLPEPMCTIYEPGFRARFHELLGTGIMSPRRALAKSRCQKVRLANPGALDNINSPQEYRDAVWRLSGAGHGAAV